MILFRRSSRFAFRVSLFDGRKLSLGVTEGVLAFHDFDAGLFCCHGACVTAEPQEACSLAETNGQDRLPDRRQLNIINEVPP